MSNLAGFKPQTDSLRFHLCLHCIDIRLLHSADYYNLYYLFNDFFNNDFLDLECETPRDICDNVGILD